MWMIGFLLGLAFVVVWLLGLIMTGFAMSAYNLTAELVGDPTCLPASLFRDDMPRMGIMMLIWPYVALLLIGAMIPEQGI